MIRSKAESFRILLFAPIAHNAQGRSGLGLLFNQLAAAQYPLYCFLELQELHDPAGLNMIGLPSVTSRNSSKAIIASSSLWH